MKWFTRILSKFTPMLFVAMFAIFIVEGQWGLAAWYMVGAFFFLWLGDE